MLHREEILILQQANEILQRHKLGGTFTPVEHLSQEINDFIFNHPQYSQRFDKTPLEHLCDFYEANPKYLEDDQFFPPTIQFAFFPHDKSIHFLQAINIEKVIGDSTEPIEYHVWEYPLEISFEESTLLWRIDTKPEEMKPIEGAYYDKDILNDFWPTAFDRKDLFTINDIYGHDLMMEVIQHHIFVWLEKHPLVFKLIKKQ